jgi:hypothetical protein
MPSSSMKQAILESYCGRHSYFQPKSLSVVVVVVVVVVFVVECIIIILCSEEILGKITNNYLLFIKVQFNFMNETENVHGMQLLISNGYRTALSQSNCSIQLIGICNFLAPKR